MSDAGGRTVHARAPLRISLAGGGTDVPPYPEQHGGAVLSSTIDLYAYATLRPRNGGRPVLRSPDLDTAAALSGRRRLARTVLEAFDAKADATLHCDAPPGSGLGSSSSLVVAACTAIGALHGTPTTPYELAEQARHLERDALGIPGGLQDQYAAAFGGWNFIEFGSDGVLVNPLRLRPDIVAELQGSLLLVPTPFVSRRSTGILQRQIAAYEAKDDDVLAALSTIRDQAATAKSCVLRGDLRGLAEVLHDGWQTKRRLASGIATPEIDELYAETRALGALGGKLLGAGGGGYLLVLVPFDARGLVVRRLRDRGLGPVHFSFTDTGAQAWHGLG